MRPSFPLRQLFCTCIVAAIVLLSSVLVNSRPVAAHGGGTPQLVNSEAGPYRLYVWTQPEPLNAGDVHVTIAVTVPDPAASGQTNSAALNQADLAVTDAEVAVNFVLTQPPQNVVAHADLIDRTGVPYYEADVVLPISGTWQTRVSVNGQEGAGEIAFELNVLPPREINWPLVGGGALLVILLLGLAIGWSRVQSDQAASTAMGLKA